MPLYKIGKNSKKISTNIITAAKNCREVLYNRLMLFFLRKNKFSTLGNMGSEANVDQMF